MDTAKLEFLQKEFIFLLRHLGPEERGKWGKMNGQQMVEHYIDAVRNASGSLPLPQVNQGERLEKFRQFLMSDKPFKENTPNPLLSDEPTPLKYQTLQDAIIVLEEELSKLVRKFEETPGLTTSNPFFGDLDYEQVIQLLHKHAMHHLHQFGLGDKAIKAEPEN